MTSTLSRVGNSAYDTSVAALTNVSFGPLVALSRFSVTALLTRLQVGQLEITDTDGSTRVYGDPTLRAKAVVNAQEAGGVVQGAARALGSDAEDLTSPQPRTPNSEPEGDSQSDGASSSQSTLAVPSPASPPSHAKASAPNASSPPRAALKVISDTFWVRMFIGADMGFAEAFMAGDVETPDLGACFSLFIHNRDALSNLNTGIFASLSSRIQSLLNRQYANTKSGSLKNIGAHYDISNTMYDAFLSRDMTYSCGVFPTLDADLFPSLSTSDGSAFNQSATAAVAKLASIAQGGTANGAISAGLSANQFSTDDLEDSQIRKLRMHISRADIRPGHRVLEIGTGWGSFAMEAARLTGCTVDSLTLSVEQKALAEARIARAGLSDRIRVHLLDYRDMPASWSDSFDRVVSIEMLEAVGIEFLETYFAAVSRVLKRRGGVGVFQCITIPEDRFEVYKDEVDFIKKYIFPGGCLPSVTRLFEAARVGSKGTLIPEGLTSIGPHYARTLREWRRKFEAHFQTQIRPALVRDHPEIRRLSAQDQEKEVEVFRKKWIYYFVYCEVGFAERVIGDHILTFVREGNTSYPAVCA